MHDTMPGDGADRTPRPLRDAVLAALEAAWVDVGYTAPNPEVYPWMWLWDSCFHSLIWMALDRPDRARTELEAALSTADSTGFVPHMGYQLDPSRAVELWGRSGSSSITQPPMYGHTIAALARGGVDVSAELTNRASAGLKFLLNRRARDESGLIRVVHPWETGCDDSPRWDDLCPGETFSVERWKAHKMELLDTIVRGPDGEPLDNPAFAVAPVGFNALVAWNGRELASVTGDDELRGASDRLATAIDSRFDSGIGTWVDGGPTASGSGRIRTADALLALLVADDPGHRFTAVGSLAAEGAHRAQFGPRGVHVDEPTYDPELYWRGAVWPQLAYLLWLATDRLGEQEVRVQIRTSTLAGALASGLAEYWDGETGAGLGASPQSWAGLALIMESAG